MPLTAGLSRAVGAVAARALSNKSPKVRIAGRAERREAYARFLEAMVRLERFAFHQRSRWRQFRLSLDETPLRSVEEEAEFAVHHLFLVGNALPLQTAHAYASLVIKVANRDLNRKHVPEELRNQLRDARDAYWAACRLDVNHGPRRWQFYRPAWWRDRHLKAAYLRELEDKTLSAITK
ncbi:hypothetical protein [Streptomyces sp. CRB46]|uniref:hypothetical protein n=1 Tax=Streptomyces sp. CRB46 TaxID=2682613 RepID=UPI0018F557AB|nr:hypothetical protein [Streptomyces sp. CRB46]